MAMQFYASPEQIMRDRAELCRKGIARGRSAVVVSYSGGVLFVAENLSSALHKVSEVYDRIGFAAVGRYNEFESLRSAGVRLADLHGYSYSRRDVTGRAIANAYARTLGAIFTEQSKPFEVEICVAEVGERPADDELYRLTYDGSVQDEPGRMAMGGQAEAVGNVLKEQYQADATLKQALHAAVAALSSVGGEGGRSRDLPASQLEVAVLDRNKTGRTFRRITGEALITLLAPEPEAPAADPETPSDTSDTPETPALAAEADDSDGAAPSEQDSSPADGDSTAASPSTGESDAPGHETSPGTDQ